MLKMNVLVTNNVAMSLNDINVTETTTVSLTLKIDYCAVLVQKPCVQCGPIAVDY